MARQAQLASISFVICFTQTISSKLKPRIRKFKAEWDAIIFFSFPRPKYPLDRQTLFVSLPDPATYLCLLNKYHRHLLSRNHHYLFCTVDNVQCTRLSHSESNAVFNEDTSFDRHIKNKKDLVKLDF